MARRRRSAAGATRREYPRTARVGQLLREIIGEELEVIADERLDGVVVTSVDIDRDLRLGQVYWDSRYGEESDDEVLEALEDHRIRLKASIGRQAHLRRTPDLVFRPDPAVRAGEHIDQVLSGMEIAPDDAPPDDAPPEGSPDGEPTAEP